MSDKGSVFQKGGGGTNFEQLVQTAFLVTLIIHGNVPCLPSSEITEVALQVSNRGYETDDFLVISKSENGKHRLLIQVKHDISFTADNVKFKEVINAFWKDYNNTLIFDKTKDKLIIAKNGLTKDERNHLKSLFNWANYHATEVDFILEVDRIKGKKQRLDMFRKVLKEANKNVDLSDKEIWEFLKCVDVLEYDFLNEGSIDKTYFFNLIKLSKSQNLTVSEREIWDSIYAYISILNPNGGSMTLESIKDEEFFQYFDNSRLSPYFKAVEKLKSDSGEILRPIKTTIGKGENELYLQRTDIREKILEAFSSSQITIVTGKPGVGKSAEIKSFLQKDFSYSSIFVFKADQFSESTISNVFSNQGVNETIQDIFSCISLIPEKIIFIDSLEKLLEADPECAFKQLLALVESYPDIKIITSSRKYAIDLIMLKFGVDKDKTKIVDISILNDNELKIVSDNFPQLNSILKNGKIRELLRSPKYIDFSLLAINKTNDNYDNISLTEFKNKLWNSLVVDSTTTRNGLPIKREKAFTDIAVKRAREMKLFITIEQSDAEAIVCLENDEIIFQENQNRKYSPTHDILEDWALVKYVSSKFEEYAKPKELFNNLGNEPAIRRAFRLWVEDYLIDNSNKITELVRITVNDQTIEKYWIDELLIAVFKSENSNSFFVIFEKELLQDNAVFFNRCLHIIKTCCKESDPKTGNNNLLLPIGSGWREILFFTQNHIADLELVKSSILNFLTNWHYRLIFQYDAINKKELEAVKSIVIYYLKEMEDENIFWEDEHAEERTEVLISILLDLAEVSQSEIEQLVERAFDYENKNSWRLKPFYESVINKCVSGVGNQRLIQEMPELVIKTAWTEWKLRLSTPSENSISSLIGTSRLSDEECWGIKFGRDFFPSGIYKTPIYHLLSFHPKVSLEFLIDFTNYSIDFYINSECEYKHEISEVDIEFNNGTIVKKWAAWELWAAYRGLSVTNYALESLLIGFEKFLLETAKIQTDSSRYILKFVLNYVLEKSNNVSLLSVLTSVFMAYPKEFDEDVIPLLGVIVFYKWDFSRSSREFSTLAPYDTKITFAQKERLESNQLPHRKKYLRGLSDFILDYQFNIRKLNLQIHDVFEKLQVKIQNEDVMWKKLLNEIDIRKWQVEEYNEEKKGVIIQPKYEEEVIEFMNSDKEYFEEQNKALLYSDRVSKVYEGKEHLDYKKWVDCYNYYFSVTAPSIYGKPIRLSILGLRDFSSNISEEQRKWCLNLLYVSIDEVLANTFGQGFDLDINYNLLEKDITLSSFHLLMKNTKNKDEEKSVEKLIVYILFAPFHNHELNKVIEYFREVFFKHCPNNAKRVWFALIEYAKFRKSNSYFYYERGADEYRELKIREEQFIEQTLSSEDLVKSDLLNVNFEGYIGYILVRVLLITPFETIDPCFQLYIQEFIPLIFEDLEKEDRHSYRRSRDERKIDTQSLQNIQFYLAELLLKADNKLSISVFNSLIEPAYEIEINDINRKYDTFDFVSKTLEYVIYKLDEIINSNDAELNDKLIQNFWILWQHFFDKTKTNEKKYFISTLLLNIEWKESSVHWKPFENKRDFYYSMVKELGRYQTASILKVLSTIGAKTLLPEALSWLVEIYKSDMTTTSSLLYPSAERLIEQLFYNHISEMKNNKLLIDDYIWILNKMVDLGSSSAYLFRENIITYKRISV